jgi:hypothetical protein
VKVILDHQGFAVRLTDERLAHILDHPEMVGLEGAIEQTLKRPALVIQSVSDETARLYYRFYSATRVGDEFVCVAVKVTGSDGFVLTAYLTDKPKEGTRAMERKFEKVWYDAEGDYLEVVFEREEGYFRETANDQVMEKVDAEGNVIGFSCSR